MHPLPIGTIDAEYKSGEPLIIEPAARRKHLNIVGATGAGKSTLLRNMIAWNIAHGADLTANRSPWRSN